jgi:hypothetical protein
MFFSSGTGESMRNALYWAQFIRDVFLPQVSYLRETAFVRLFPTFDNIEDEANRTRNEAWERFCQATGEDDDPGDLADAADEAGWNAIRYDSGDPGPD